MRWMKLRGRRVGGYLVFVCIALVLWYLHKLSHEYTLQVEVPLSFERLPQGVLLEGGRERVISVRVRGHGYSLLKYKYSGWLSPHEVDLRDAWVGLPMDSTGARVLYRGQLSALVSGLLPSGVSLDGVVSDSIRLPFGTHAMAYRHVGSRLSYRVAAQHVQVGGVRVHPDSVLVSGTNGTLSRWDSVYTRGVDLGVLDMDVSGSVGLESEEGLMYSSDQVDYAISVSRFTECRLTLPVRLEGVPDTLRGTVLPSSVELVCNVPLKAYRGVSADSFRVVARYAPEAAGRRLLLRMERRHSGVFNVDFTPKFANVYVERMLDEGETNWNHRTNRQWQELRGY